MQVLIPMQTALSLSPSRVQANPLQINKKEVDL